MNGSENDLIGAGDDGLRQMGEIYWVAAGIAWIVSLLLLDFFKKKLHEFWEVAKPQ